MTDQTVVQSEIVSTNQIGESQISQVKSYFESQSSLQIPEDILQRFIFNCEHEDHWYQSDIVYDEWFLTYYTRYAKFIDGVKNELLDEFDYKLVISNEIISTRDQVKLKGVKKTIYLISYTGLKQLEIKQNRNTRIYYAQLEKLFGQFIKSQLALKEYNNNKQLALQEEESKKQLALKDAEIAILSQRNPESVYIIRRRQDNAVLYVGEDNSIAQNRRFQHLTQRTNITQAGYQLIDLALATMDVRDIIIEFEECVGISCGDLETQYIDQLKPLFNVSQSNNIYLCSCTPGKPYKNRKSYEKHLKTKKHIDQQSDHQLQVTTLQASIPIEQSNDQQEDYDLSSLM